MLENRKLNNKGLSLVELIISVTILSILMIGMSAILSSMSRDFSRSQTEIALQDNVQSTFSIVSNLIQEAQPENSGSSDKAVVKAGNTTKIYSYGVVSELTPATISKKLQSEYTILTLDPDTNILYLAHGDIYESTDGKTVTKLTEPSEDKVKVANNILATDVTAFDVDTYHYADGYVIVNLTCEKRGRSASITQNVYLRNSNISAEEGSNKDHNNESVNLDGYKVIKVTKRESNNITKDDDITSSSFTLTGDFQNDAGDIKTGEYINPALYTVCWNNHNGETTLDINDVVDKIETSGKTVYFVFYDGIEYYSAPGNSMTVTLSNGKVISKDPDDEENSPGIETPSPDTTKADPTVEVSFSYSPATEKEETQLAKKTCKGCGAPITGQDPYNNHWYYCKHNNFNCPGNIAAGSNGWYDTGMLPSNNDSQYVNVTYEPLTLYNEKNYGTGVITIQNIGEDDIQSATIVIYMEGGAKFTKKGSKFIDWEKEGSSSAPSASYLTSSGNGATSTDYIEITVYNLAANPTDTRKSDKIKITYQWTMPKDNFDKGIRPNVAVYREGYVKKTTS